MPWIERELVPGLSSSTGLVGWILVAYLITFPATRAITRAIRSDRGPFRGASAAGSPKLVGSAGRSTRPLAPVLTTKPNAGCGP